MFAVKEPEITIAQLVRLAITEPLGPGSELIIFRVLTIDLCDYCEYYLNTASHMIPSVVDIQITTFSDYRPSIANFLSILNGMTVIRPRHSFNFILFRFLWFHVGI